MEECVRSGVLDEGLADQVFVLMGATSEMGPAQTLLDLGATVVALAPNPMPEKSVPSRSASLPETVSLCVVSTIVGQFSVS